MQLELDRLGQHIFQIAKSFHDESDSNWRSYKHDLQKIKTDLRQKIRFETCEHNRKESMKRLWKEVHATKKISAIKELGSLKKHSVYQQFTPHAFRFDRVMSYDREECVRGAFEFGLQRFGDSVNDHDFQIHRL